MDLVDPMPVGAYPVDRDGEAGVEPAKTAGGKTKLEAARA